MKIIYATIITGLSGSLAAVRFGFGCYLSFAAIIYSIFLDVLNGEVYIEDISGVILLRLTVSPKQGMDCQQRKTRLL